MACGCCGFVSKKMNAEELRVLKTKMEKAYLESLEVRQKAIKLNRQYHEALVALYGPPPPQKEC